MIISSTSRRDFIKKAGIGAAALTVHGCTQKEEQLEPEISLAQTTIPRWRGFNLMQFFAPGENRVSNGIANVQDLQWISDWGFDFIRLPMAYPRWVEYDRSRPITKDDVYNIKESTLEQIDTMVDLAQKYNLHISLNFHRGPGYCVNSGFQEPFDLWNDQDALDAFCYHWGMFAERYRAIPSSRISFDLINEPSVRDLDDQHAPRTRVPGEKYRRVAQAAAKAIRAANPDHLIIADGNNVGREVIPEIADLGIAQSCRGYNPGSISHYKASWASTDPNPPVPVWPGMIGDEMWDRERLAKLYDPWADLARQGIGVHCGECGCYNKTPHNVFLAWFRDLLEILTDHGIGWGLWNFRHEYAFGVLDSGREDVEYEDWYGSKLDRKLLDLLQKF